MPKSNEKDAYFFSHDCNARNDPKILALRSVYGAEGYGVYFMLIEILREQPEYKLAVNKYIWAALAMQMQVDASRVEQIITDCCTEFCENGKPLVINDGEYLYSPSLLRRMGRVDDISNLRREAANKRWGNRPCKAESETCKETEDSGVCPGNANAEQTDANKRKGNKRKENKTICTIGAKEKKATPKKSDPFVAFADGDPELLAALRGFNEMRVKIKKPMTDQAKRRLLTELEKLAPGDRAAQIAILHQSEDRCWAGVFALKDDGPYRSRSGPQQASAADKAQALRELHDTFSGGEGG